MKTINLQPWARTCINEALSTATGQSYYSTSMALVTEHTELRADALSNNSV